LQHWDAPHQNLLSTDFRREWRGGFSPVQKTPGGIAAVSLTHPTQAFDVRMGARGELFVIKISEYFFTNNQQQITKEHQLSLTFMIKVN
jgi:hypothetical protein